MDTQTLIVGIIICAALAYVGWQVWLKARSFSSKKGCGADCGCGTKSKSLESQGLK